MDQYPFELKLTIVGMDVFEFIDLLRNNGYESQAEDAEIQVNEQMS